MTAFNVKILSPDHVFYEGECLSLSIPTPDGMYGILAHHSNTITAIVPGIMNYTLPGQEKKEASVSIGMVKIEGGEVLILVDTIERPEDIDINLAKKQEAESKEALLQKHTRWQYNTAQATLARVMTRINLNSRYMR